MGLAGRTRSCILVLGVSYHSDADTRAFVEDVLAGSDAGNLSVIIVDNSSPSTLAESMKDVLVENPNFSILTPGRNLGYYGAATWALSTYCTSQPLPEWTIVSNVDLAIRAENFFQRLIDFGSQHDFDVIAPAISSELSRRDQNPFMVTRPSPGRMHFYKSIFRYYPINVAYSMLSLSLLKLRSLRVHTQEVKLKPSLNRPISIYAPHGSFIAFRSSYFEKGGTLDHPVFLFGEEIFVAETARRLGLTIGYDPRLQVIHREHKSTGYFPSRRISAYSSEAATYCADHYFGDGPVLSRCAPSGERHAS